MYGSDAEARAASDSHSPIRTPTRVSSIPEVAARSAMSWPITCPTSAGSASAPRCPVTAGSFACSASVLIDCSFHRLTAERHIRCSGRHIGSGAWQERNAEPTRGLIGELCVQAHELPYAEQAQSSPQHRVERGGDERLVVCPVDELGAGGAIGAAAEADGAPRGGPYIARPVGQVAEGEPDQ